MVTTRIINDVLFLSLNLNESFAFQIKEQKVVVDELSNLKKNRVRFYKFAFNYFILAEK